MSGRALGWAKEQSAPSVVAKAVLVCLADYADADMRAWPKIATIGREVQVSRRTVQRALSDLEECGLIVREARQREDGGNGVPLYILQTPVSDCHRPRVTSDTPPVPMVTPRNDPPVEQEGSDEPSPVRVKPIWETDPDFTAAWDAATPRMKERSDSREKTWPIWLEARRKSPPARIIAGLQRYSQTEDVKRAGGEGFHRWLRDGRWENFQPLVGLPAAPDAVFPDEWIRAAVVAERGEAFARSFLDPCEWDEEAGELVAFTDTGLQRLKRDVGKVLSQLGVTGYRVQRRAA